MSVRGGIAGGHHLVDGPVGGVPTAAPVDGAECVLRAQSAVRRFKNSDISLEPKGRPAPVRTAPRAGMVKTQISRLGFAFRHTLNRPSPDHARIKLPGLRACDRLYIGRIAFEQPLALPWHSRQRKVRHFMDQDPVVPKG